MTARYEIETSGGVREYADTYAAATSVVRETWPDATIGHPGDICDGETYSLCWADAATAYNDDGANACAIIRDMRSPH